MFSSVTSGVADQSVVAEFVVDADDFALGRTLGAHPEITVRLERVVPLGESNIPYLWVEDGSTDHLLSAIEADPGVADVSVVDSVDGRVLVRTEWTADGDGLVASITAVGAQILEAVGSGDWWSLQLRFPSHEALAAFHEECSDHGVALDLRSILNRTPPDDPSLEGALTDLQRETVLAALDAGYFSVPRETTLEELAERMGVSDTAISQRLRRGLASLVRANLQGSDEVSQRADDASRDAEE